MDVLILGGTQFVGRHLVEAALEAGHKVTLFNRGKTNPGLYPAAEELHGDRDGDLDVLKGRTWDVVVDAAGYVPRVVRQSAELLRDAVGRYVFVSSISVYTDPTQTNEDGPLAQLADPTTEDILPNYGGLKVACEAVVSEIYGERALHVRPGFIVGRYDTIPRLPHLVQRFDSDGEKLAGRPEQPVQIIHARDIADWILGAVPQKLHGAYNMTGRPMPMQTLLDALVQASGKAISVTYTEDDFLLKQGVAPIDGLTFWMPQAAEAMMGVPIERTLATGLTPRPVADIIRESVDWVRAGHFKADWFGDAIGQRRITAEKEAEVLAAWHARG